MLNVEIRETYSWLCQGTLGSLPYAPLEERTETRERKEVEERIGLRSLEEEERRGLSSLEEEDRKESGLGSLTSSTGGAGPGCTQSQ